MNYFKVHLWNLKKINNICLKIWKKIREIIYLYFIINFKILWKVYLCGLSMQEVKRKYLEMTQRGQEEILNSSEHIKKR